MRLENIKHKKNIPYYEKGKNISEQIKNQGQELVWVNINSYRKIKNYIRGTLAYN